jgi:hypothetical protein
MALGRHSTVTVKYPFYRRKFRGPIDVQHAQDVVVEGNETIKTNNVPAER